MALFNPKASYFIQKRHPYFGSLNSEMCWDSKCAFSHYAGVLVESESAAFSTGTHKIACIVRTFDWQACSIHWISKCISSALQPAQTEG